MKGLLQMTELIKYLVVAIDGNQVIATLPKKLCQGELVKAPGWLLRKMGLTGQFLESWYLQPAGCYNFKANKGCEPSNLPKLCLVRTVSAAAAPSDPRQGRLKTERLRLEKINEESDFVRVEQMNVLEGSEPEQYKITFLCRGIVGIDSSQKPIYGDRHEVEMICDEDFPSEVPRLRWITQIWQPNIQHEEPKGVCINPGEWLAGMGLDDVCRMMFEMVQYKNYHAEFCDPYPLDSAVAKWVLEYAEPQGIVDNKRGIFVDDKPFTRPTDSSETSVVAPSMPTPQEPRIKLRDSRLNKPKESRIKIVGSEKKPVQTRGSGQIKIRKTG